MPPLHRSRLTRPLALLTLAAAVTAVAGCQSPAPTAAAPSTAPSTAPSAEAAPASASATPDAGGSGSGGSGSGGSGGGTGGGTGGSAPAATRCTLDQLKATTGRTTGEAGQRHTSIVWTNTSSRPCTMTGFGGVDLRGPADPMGTTYSLPRAGTSPSAVRLASGGTAHTTITWLPPQDGPGWTPTSVLVTPPDETRSATVRWPGGAVLRQDGATHPGTFIDPVRPGSEG